MLRIPIHPSFIPYAGIGYKFSLQSLTQTGSGTDIFAPITGKDFGAEFGISQDYTGSISGLLNLFTYIAGIQFYIFDHVGIGVEYQYMAFGDTKYYRLGLGNFTYDDPQYGTITSNTTHSLDLVTSPLKTHVIHIAVLFKFN